MAGRLFFRPPCHRFFFMCLIIRNLCQGIWQAPRPVATIPQAHGKPFVMLYASEPAGLTGGAGGAEAGTGSVADDSAAAAASSGGGSDAGGDVVVVAVGVAARNHFADETGEEE